MNLDELFETDEGKLTLKGSDKEADRLVGIGKAFHNVVQYLFGGGCLPEIITTCSKEKIEQDLKEFTGNSEDYFIEAIAADERTQSVGQVMKENPDVTKLALKNCLLKIHENDHAQICAGTARDWEALGKWKPILPLTFPGDPNIDHIHRECAVFYLKSYEEALKETRDISDPPHKRRFLLRAADDLEKKQKNDKPMFLH